MNSNIFDNIVVTENELNNLKHNYKYDVISVDDKSRKIAKMGVLNANMKKFVHLLYIKIYEKIIKNNELKKFLMMNNLIDSKGIPVFINDIEEMVLFNEMKIILIVLGENKFFLKK